MTIQLEFEELQSAARTIADGVLPLQDLLTTLSDGIESASSGFAGQASVGLGEALSAWFEVAVTLGPILDGYAQAIMTVANEHLRNEGTQTESYQRLGQRLGGPQ